MRALTRSPAKARTRLRARADDGVERGSSTVEFVIGAALMVFMLMSIIQIAVYFHLRSVATTVARQGLDRVRVYNGSTESGISAANEFLDQSGDSLEQRNITAARGPQTSTVTVKGHVISVIPLLDLSVTVTVDAPTERVEP